MEKRRNLVEDLVNAREFIIVDIKSGRKYVFLQEYFSIAGSKKGKRIIISQELGGVMTNFEKILSFFFSLKKKKNIVLRKGDKKIKIPEYNVIITMPGVMVGKKEQRLVAINE